MENINIHTKYKIEKTIFDTWFNRKVSLVRYKFKTYDDYLNSSMWFKIKKKLKKDPLFKECLKCGSTNKISLHHKHYKTLGIRFAKKCLIPVCSNCHKHIHSIADEKGCSVEKATNICLNGKFIKVKEDKPKKKFQNTSKPIVLKREIINGDLHITYKKGKTTETKILKRKRV